MTSHRDAYPPDFYNPVKVFQDTIRELEKNQTIDHFFLLNLHFFARNKKANTRYQLETNQQ